MRSTLFRLIFCFTAVTVAGVVRVEASLDAIYSIAVSGRNSDGTRATTNRKNNGEHPLQEGDFLGATDSVEGSTDSGFGTAHIALFGTHRDKKALLGAQIGGGASLARLPFAEGGEISAGGNARVGYHEVLTFDGSLSPPVLMHIQGFLKLHGSISASSSKTGSLTLGAASTSVTLTGTGIDSDTTFRTVFQRAGQSQQTVGAENLNIVPFSYFVFPGNLNHVDYVLNVFGNAQVSARTVCR